MVIWVRVQGLGQILHTQILGNMLFCKGVYFFLGVPSFGIYALHQPVQGHPMLFTTSHLLHEVPE
jgi:hypothetical protein